jgi:hypothetical protein
MQHYAQQQQAGAGYNPYYAQQMQQYYAYQQYAQNQQAMYAAQGSKQKAQPVSKAPEELKANSAKQDPTITRQNKPPIKDRSFAGKVDEYGIPIVDTSSSKVNPVKPSDTSNVKKKMSFSYDEFGIPLIDEKPNKSGKIASKPVVAHSFDPDDPYCGIIDPDVRAFMERRKLREQQRKEEKLKKELEEEAKKMLVCPNKVVEKAQEILKSRSGTISNAPSTDLAQPNLSTRATELARGIEPDAVRTSRAASNDEEFVMSPNLNNNIPPPVATNPVNDPSHILHNSNLIAFKAAAALFQLAKKHPTITMQAKEVQNQAATQLAGLWLNQTAYYLSKIDSTREKANAILKAGSHDPSDKPTASSEQSSKIPDTSPPPVHINILKERSFVPNSNALATKISPTYAATTAKKLLTRKSSLSSSNNSSFAANSSQSSNSLRKVSSSSSMRKDVIEMMSSKLSDNIKSKANGENPTLLRKSKSSSMYNVLEGVPQREKPTTPTVRNTYNIWECKMCTLLNKPSFLVCEVCGNQRESS